MSTLGNYIHYYWNTYNKYGSSRKTPGNNGIAVIESAKNKILANLNSQKRQAGLSQLESALNGMIYPATEEDAQANEKMQKMLETYIADELTKWATDYEGLSITGSGKKPDSYKFGVKSGFHLQSVKDLRDRVDRMLHELAANPTTETYKKLETVLQLADQAAKIAETQIQASGIHEDFYSYKAMNNYQKGKYNALIRQLNDALTAVSAATYQQTAGDLLEYGIASLDDSADEIIEAKADSLIREVVTGNNKSKITLSGIGASNKLLKKTIRQTKQDATAEIDILGDTANLSSTFKADVILTYNDEQYRISAKNYLLKDSSTIHLVQQTPLLLTLLKNTSNDFVNHSMNILLSLGSSGEQRRQQMITNNVIKTILAIEAISGISQKAGSADTLVINNRSKREVKVFNIADLINNTSLSAFTFGNYEDLQNRARDYNQWVYKQGQTKRIPDQKLAKVRIDKLLIALYQQKISVSINYNKIT